MNNPLLAFGGGGYDSDDDDCGPAPLMLQTGGMQQVC